MFVIVQIWFACMYISSCTYLCVVRCESCHCILFSSNTVFKNCEKTNKREKVYFRLSSICDVNTCA